MSGEDEDEPNGNEITRLTEGNIFGEIGVRPAILLVSIFSTRNVPVSTIIAGGVDTFVFPGGVDAFLLNRGKRICGKVDWITPSVRLKLLVN